MTEHLKELREKLSGLMVYYFFIDENGKTIKKEPHSDVLRMKFLRKQSAEDLFLCEDNGKVYSRQPGDSDYVYWCTTSKMKNGDYEADCPIRSGLTVEVMNFDGGIEFTEVMQNQNSCNNLMAKKIGLFSYEWSDSLSEKIAAEHSLSDYYAWKRYLISDKASSEFASDYDDNWLFCMDTTISTKRIGKPFYYMSQKCCLTETQYIHNISNKEWTCLELCFSSNDQSIRL